MVIHHQIVVRSQSNLYQAKMLCILLDKIINYFEKHSNIKTTSKFYKRSKRNVFRSCSAHSIDVDWKSMFVEMNSTCV